MGIFARWWLAVRNKKAEIEQRTRERDERLSQNLPAIKNSDDEKSEEHAFALAFFAATGAFLWSSNRNQLQKKEKNEEDTLV